MPEFDDFDSLPSAKATEIVKQRQGQYGHPGPIYATVAKLWSAYTGTYISPTDVSAMMGLLKVGREKHRHNPDNLDDIAGYANVQEMVRQWVEDITAIVQASPREPDSRRPS